MEKWKYQYLAQFKDGYAAKNGRWLNAKMCMGGDSNYCESEEEAGRWLKKAIELGLKYSKKGSTIAVNGIGISTDPSNMHLVVGTRIRKRKVTEWEEV